MLPRNQSYSNRSRKCSSSPMMQNRFRKGVSSVDRLSQRSNKKLVRDNIDSYNQPKLGYKYQKSNLKISLQEQESFSRSPHSARTRSRLCSSSTRHHDQYKSKRNLKSCKSMRSIGSRGWYSTRSRKSENWYQSSKNYKSARDTPNMYSNYLTSGGLKDISLFNKLAGTHGPKRSIDTNQASITNDNNNPFKRNNSDNLRSSDKKNCSRNSKIYNYSENQYSSCGL